MREFALDLRAEALLLTVVETVGGDLRAAFAVLCSRASLADINGESFEAALTRAVAELFSRPAPTHAAIHAAPLEPVEDLPEPQA
ncbi:hypothetical protein MCBMB27_02652 [Methylobacterium phyllosphaerae]|uniref:Uncharacterized protein n=1 Tax=Methylobacterium phyllosphaerae TaxID=418223 RepID=A0AAE8HSH6_9HYPH|nr:hypothetical protein [Methylobacterium phyllosphaerae]APT31943.1 hypothetical protein MCBMB27_02652 [Methylobacterium phyllosphaerae]SFH01151.1 hypothetical protein SAMN05192567_11215 [Methylobacterium phyllosphaerae]